MEWNWRTFIILLCLMLVVGIIVDGIRRMRRNRELASHMDLDPHFIDHASDANPELPNGGWRLVTQPDDEAEEFSEALSALEDDDSAAEESSADLAYIQELVGKPEDYQTPPQVKAHEPETETETQEPQVTVQKPETMASRPVDLDEQVPLLLEVEELGEALKNTSAVAAETLMDEYDDLPNDPNPEAEMSLDLNQAPEEPIEETPTAMVDLPNSLDDVAPDVASTVSEPAASSLNVEEIASPVNFAHPSAEKLKDRGGAELTLVIHCIVPLGNSLDGKQLAHLFNSCDLRLGDDHIFHRYEQTEGKGNIQFSAVHSYEPQAFDANKLLDRSYYGFSLFMRLPGPKEPLKAYEAMLGLAKFLEQQYDADLYDIDRSALTQQTIEHDRQQIIDFERRQQVAAKKMMRG